MADLAYPDIQAYLKRSDLILIPMASTEQHGPHLPLSTDTTTAIEVSKRAAEQANVLYTPTVWTGYSPQHMRGPGQGMGTITIRAETLNNLLYDIARSLIHHGFNKLIFVNGHGSNVKVIDPVLRKIRYDTGAMVAFYKPYAERYMGLVKELMENPPEETPGWHSSELETSQMLAHNARAGAHGSRRDRRETHIPSWLPSGVQQGRRRARRGVQGLSVLPVPDGSRRVHRHRRHRQPVCAPPPRRASRRSAATPRTSPRRCRRWPRST